MTKNNRILRLHSRKIARKIGQVLVVCLLLFKTSAQAQQKFTLNGTIRDSATGETLIGATVRVAELNGVGTSANNYGFYSLTLPQGKYTLVISYIGYQTINNEVNLGNNQTLNLTLQATGSLQEVVVRVSKKNNDQVTSPQMGVEKLNMAQINRIPVVLGEKDLLKTITLMPGIKSAGEGNTGYYVRGGAADQNLVLLDEAQVYNASHLLGFFSTFNSDAIKDVTIYKGGMPAEYGGRLSSVLDVKMDEGNTKDYTLQGGIGLISSRIKAEGPLWDDKGSFMISARRTYLDLFTGLSHDTTVKNSQLYFYDINAKANYHIDDKNTIYLSGYFGKDVIGLQNTFGTNWGNATGTIRWNHLLSSKLFLNTSLVFSNYNFAVSDYEENNYFKATSRINDINLKEDFQYNTDGKHTLKFGLNIIHHDMAPGDVSTDDASSFNPISVEHRYGYENAAYFSDEWHVSDHFTLLYGVRLTDMLLLGPGTFSTYDAAGNIVSSKTYGSGDVVKNYFNPEPRISASYIIDDANSVKFSYNRNTQNIHLLSNSTSANPTDLYEMSSNNIKPGIADQVSTGWFRNFQDNTYEFSAEIYYKWLQNQIDYKDGAQLVANQDVESQLVYGSGRAYGIELFLKKKYGRFNGWIGYTWSRTENKFAAINNGQYYPATQDRPNDFSIVGIYKLSDRWSLSSDFVYSTGQAVTYPTGKYNVGGLTTFSYSQRNSFREPSTNRLDIAATLQGAKHKNYESSWTFSIYNVYGHHDPYTITFRDSKTVPGTTEAVETSIFATAIPSVTWNFNFK